MFWEGKKANSRGREAKFSQGRLNQGGTTRNLRTAVSGSRTGRKVGRPNPGRFKVDSTPGWNSEFFPAGEFAKLRNSAVARSRVPGTGVVGQLGQGTGLVPRELKPRSSKGLTQRRTRNQGFLGGGQPEGDEPF